MKKRIARIVLRDSGSANDGLIIGALMKEGLGVLKPGRVYELRMWDGDDSVEDNDIEVVDMGESCVPRDNTVRAAGHIGSGCWQNSVDGVLNACSGGYVVLTRAEYEAL